MGSLQDGERKRVAVVLGVLLMAGACSQQSHKLGTGTSAPVVPEQQVEVQPPPPAYTGPLRLYEVRLIETAGQHSVLFRFSRPPEGVDYFPLRGPSRLVIDVKGAVEPLPKIQSYKAVDPLVAAVRVGSYQGRMRLVVDLKGGEVPQFSVDNYDTLLTAFIGEKTNGKGPAESNAQVLFISDEARDGHFAPLTPAVEKPEPAPVEEKTLTAASPPAETAVPAEASINGTANEATETPLSTASEDTAPAETAVTEASETASPPPTGASSEEATPPEPATFSANVEEDEPEEMAQVAPPAEATPPAPRGERERRGPTEETLPPPAGAESAVPAAEFRATPEQQYTGRKISLDFKNADILDVLRIIADVSGLNIVATDDVRARVTLRLVEVPWDQALDVVLQANGLEKTRVGNVITVSTTRRLEAERNARLAAQNAQQRLAPLETEYVKINYVKATDVVALITREVQQRAAAAGAAPAPRPAAPAARPAAVGARTQVALMSPRGTIAADPTTNVLIIRDVRENINAVRELIRNLDVQTPQVMIESYLVTANENLNRDLGIQWGYRYIASPETGNPTGVNFPGRIGLGGSGLGTGVGGLPFIADFPASAVPGRGSALDLVLGSLDGSQELNIRLSALETQGKARVVSRPRVVTLNNKVADIRARRVVRVPIISGSLTVSGTQSTVGGGNAFQEFDVGVTLKVTPQISSDGFVLLDIDAETSELTDSSVQPSGAASAFPLIPDTLTRTASSNVLIHAGDTFVLGGILQDNLRQQERGIPYLRSTPGLGWLFKSRNNTRTKDELLVFITPRLVAGVSTAGLPTAQQLWENRPREAAPAGPVQPPGPAQP